MKATANKAEQGVEQGVISFSAVMSFISFYKRMGCNLDYREAKTELVRRFYKSVPFFQEISGDDNLPLLGDGQKWLVHRGGFWPLLLLVDVRGVVINCLPLGKWISPVETFHILPRFKKHSARIGRVYASDEEATKDMLCRLLRSHKIEVDDELKKGVPHFKRYPDSLYAIEDRNAMGSSLLFTMQLNFGKKGKKALVLITCYLLNSVGASRAKPKSRHSRAKDKQKMRRFLFITEEEE